VTNAVTTEGTTVLDFVLDDAGLLARQSGTRPAAA